MQQDPDLSGDEIRVVFASGPADLNRALIDLIAGAHPEFPLYVVGEFEPEPGKFSEWVPYHVLRGFRENLAAVRAGIGNKRIQPCRDGPLAGRSNRENAAHRLSGRGAGSDRLR